jgi:hypothetical protein
LKNIANQPTTKASQQSRQKQRVQPLTEPITGSIINQLKEILTQPTHTPHPKGQETQTSQARGLNSAYSALTLSTLLSSQDSLTHRTRSHNPAWGDPSNITQIRISNQIELLDPPGTRLIPKPSNPCGVDQNRS